MKSVLYLTAILSSASTLACADVLAGPSGAITRPNVAKTFDEEWDRKVTEFVLYDWHKNAVGVIDNIDTGLAD